MPGCSPASANPPPQMLAPQLAARAQRTLAVGVKEEPVGVQLPGDAVSEMDLPGSRSMLLEGADPAAALRRRRVHTAAPTRARGRGRKGGGEGQGS